MKTYYRTERVYCIGCRLRVTYRIRVADARWRGSIAKTITKRECPRCQSIIGLEKEGDAACHEFIERNAGGFA